MLARTQAGPFDIVERPPGRYDRAHAGISPVDRARGSDPAAGGPAKQFLTAAQAAGIDVEDGAALRTFIAGWNARSEAP